MIKQLLEKVTEMMKPYPVYAVGGCVRDYILEVEPKDYDFCTPALPDDIERLIKRDKRRAYKTGKKFGTMGCKIDGHFVEITTFRKETYEKGNRKPDVVYVDSINEDLSRRDFTINSMAIRLTKGHLRILDPFNGAEDLEKWKIKCVDSPRLRFKEDPLRMLRAIRFACRFGWAIETITYKKIESGAVNILTISKERWMSELDKILLSDNTDLGLLYLWKSRLFNYMIPELSLQFNYEQNSEYHDFKLHEHTMKVVRACPKDINLRWAALLHDIAKPFVRTDKIITDIRDQRDSKSNYVAHEILGAEMVKRIADHLNWSNERTEAVTGLVRNHLNEDCLLRQYDNEAKKDGGNKNE